jgi:hypothetical protein
MSKSNRKPSPHQALIDEASESIESFLNSGGIDALDEDRSDRVLVVIDPSDRIGDRLISDIGWQPMPFWDGVRERMKAGDQGASLLMHMSEAGVLTVKQALTGPMVGVAQRSKFAPEIRAFLARVFALRGADQVVAMTVTAGTLKALCLNMFARPQAEA